MINATSLLQRALELYEKKDFESSHALILKILSLTPNNADALHLCGLILGSQKRTKEAIQYLNKAHKLQPQNPYIQHNLGKTLSEDGLLNEALKYFEKAIIFLPNNNRFLFGYANTLYKLDQLNNCITACRKMLNNNSKDTDAKILLGQALSKAGQVSEAITYFKEALNENDKNEHAWNSLGLALGKCGRHAEAIEAFDKAICANPQYREAWLNKGSILNDIDRIKEAEICFENCFCLDATKADSWINKSFSAMLALDHKKSLEYLSKAISLEPKNRKALANTALSLLATGDYKNGWIQYENRWNFEEAEVYRYPEIPALQDSVSLIDKTVLVWAEQGFGDTIQFMRLIPELQAQGADVIFEVQDELKTLVSEQLDCEVFSRSQKPPRKPHYQIPLISLARYLNLAPPFTPRQCPYVKASKKKIDEWHRKIGKNKKTFNIGLVCAGNAKHLNDARRSIPLEYFVSLGEIGDVFLIQKELRHQDYSVVSMFSNLHLISDEIADFSDSAAIIANMDVIVSVDTAVAHLAGAMGATVYLALPYSPDWRWCDSNASHSWYPTVKIVKQSEKRDWHEVIHKVKSSISEIF